MADAARGPHGPVHAACAAPAKRPQSRYIRWTKQRRETFLNHLAATCNVTASAAAAGVTTFAVYHLRRRDPRFAEDWHAALLLGYEMLETRVVGHALAGGGAMLDAAGQPPVDVELALRLLVAHGNRLKGKPLRGGPPLKVATPEETDKAILKQLELLEKRKRAAAAIGNAA